MSKIKIINFLSRKKTHILILLALIIITLHQGIFFNWISDDAFISYRYAENFSSGHGLVFNPGEKIEGYSNFLWVMIASFLNILGLSPLLSSKFISYFISLLIIFLVFKTSQAFRLNKLTSSLCALALSFSSSIAYYSMSGLETVLYTFLLILGVFLNEKYENKPAQKDLFILYVVLLAVAITRPEGILYLLISSGYHFSKRIITKKGITLKKILMVQFFSFSVYGFLIILRYWYYSDLLPNTFYAKPKGTFVEMEYNAFYTNFTNALLSGSFLLIPIFFLLISKKHSKKYLFSILFCIGQIIFMSYAGDWMAFGRFFLPILPIVFILFFSLLSSTMTDLKKYNTKLLQKFIYITLIILLAGSNAYQTERAITNKDVYPYLVMNSSFLIHLGKWLKQNFPQETVIALRRQGAVPYYSRMKSIDILGLTEKEMARIIYKEKDIILENKINAEYIVNRKPDVIILFSFKPDYGGWMFDKSKPEDRLFHIEYLIYKQAIQRGYKYLNFLLLGSKEKAHILTAPQRNI